MPPARRNLGVEALKTNRLAFGDFEGLRRSWRNTRRPIEVLLDLIESAGRRNGRCQVSSLPILRHHVAHRRKAVVERDGLVEWKAEPRWAGPRTFQMKVNEQHTLGLHFVDVIDDDFSPGILE